MSDVSDDRDPSDEPVPGQDERAPTPQPQDEPVPRQDEQAPAPQPEDDPRDEPAPLAALVLLTAGSAVAVMVLAAFLSQPPRLNFLLFGPVALVAFEVVAYDVWWRRWWGAIPGALLGLLIYFEGRAALSDVIGEVWAHPVAYVLAWTLFAVVFALCSRYPRRVS
ncbi:hypothetical protein B0I32_111104 [Nonomuraea fuscirosea]|uniref:Uncharacterized protein n=1 Tax=Nonomuraea fuscirosea TaxID=1291556 RepID=A0A2T0MW03_9ACTN|nr:hypothetical protein B0I32_111104 [Nonomuraea fuscirosea]